MPTMTKLHRNQDFLYKLCFCGDGGVGKTTIINRYLGRDFDTNYKVTIGCNITTHHQLIDGQQIKFQLWDLAGQPRFEFVRTTFYRGSHAAILVFDRTRYLSLQNLDRWIDEIYTNVGYEIPLIILGNKSDLIDKTQVNENEMPEMILELKEQRQISEIPYFFTSGKSGLNLNEALVCIGRILRKTNPNPVYANILKKTKVKNAS